MGRKQISCAIVMAVGLLLLTGCITSSYLDGLCREVAREYPEARFEREFSLSLGSISIGTARLVAGFSEDGREVREYLSDVTQVQIAVYKVRDLPTLTKNRIPDALGQMLKDDGWEVVVKAQEDDEIAWILFHEDKHGISDVHITALDDEELVMVRVSGRLDELLDKALDDHHELLGSIGDMGH